MADLTTREPGDEADRQALLTILTTEHFTLQGARSNTVGESTARATLFVGAASASLVALSLLAQATQMGNGLAIFVLVVLPTLYALGTFTFARLVACSIEDLTYGRAINRIRAYYRQVAGEQARYLALTGHDDVTGVLANMGITRTSRWQLYFTLAAMIAVLNGIIGASAVAFAVSQFGVPVGVAAAVGAMAGTASVTLNLRWQGRAHRRAAMEAVVLFPS